jgi:hypothetical protein
MSFDDCAEVRQLARQHGFRVQRVGVSYSLSNAAGTRGHRGEVLITPRAA